MWQRWAILAAGLALIIGIGVLTQRFQVKQLARTNAQQADTAAAAGDFQKAELLYGQHLRVVPDDDDIKIKYADLLHTYSPSPIRQTEALEIYAGILKRFPGREDVRRKQMELKFAMGRFGDEGAIADLSILLSTPANQSDGDLLYKMGFCCEESRRETKARDYYREAIAHNAPKKIDAYLKLAALLRDPDRLNEPKAADQAIEEMVQSAPENYQVYLARGRYRRQFNLPDSRSDFEKALKLADNKPDIYLELAKIAESQGGSEAAKRVLETGLTKLPTAAELYIALADLIQRAGHLDQAAAVLESGLKSASEKPTLRWLLANYLASLGDTGKLRLRIDELRNDGISPFAIQFLMAHYHVNSGDFRKARQLLVQLESLPGMRAEFKTRVSNLLARCYSQLGEPGMQREAYVRSLAANPQDIQAKHGLIELMLRHGEVDEAIKEYRTLVKVVPRLNVPFAQQLMARLLQRPASQRDWSEVKEAIDAADKALPGAFEPCVLRAEFYLGQDQRDLASQELAQGAPGFPKTSRSGAHKPTSWRNRRIMKRPKNC